MSEQPFCLPRSYSESLGASIVVLARADCVDAATSLSMLLAGATLLTRNQ